MRTEGRRDSCDRKHFKYLEEGRMQVSMTEGESEVEGEGEAFS